jgi:conjugative transfer signal peptidase TraF
MTGWVRGLAAGAGAAVLQLAVSVAAVGVFPINTSPSLPIGFYRVASRTSPVVGDVVLVCLRHPLADTARARGYLTRGRCASGVEPLGKRVAARMGDTVAVTPDGVIINGRLIAHTTPLRVDSRGRPLPQLLGDRWILQSGELWLSATRHWRSFDSRYLGPVSIEDVVATVHPAWTW